MRQPSKADDLTQQLAEAQDNQDRAADDLFRIMRENAEREQDARQAYADAVAKVKYLRSTYHSLKDGQDEGNLL